MQNGAEIESSEQMKEKFETYDYRRQYSDYYAIEALDKIISKCIAKECA